MRKLILAGISVAVVALAALAPGTALASTRPVHCGPIWTDTFVGERARIAVKSWQTAPDVHRNIPCRVLLRDARKLMVTDNVNVHNWMFERARGRTVTYYGGHGSQLQIRYRSRR